MTYENALKWCVSALAALVVYKVHRGLQFAKFHSFMTYEKGSSRYAYKVYEDSPGFTDYYHYYLVFKRLFFEAVGNFVNILVFCWSF